MPSVWGLSSNLDPISFHVIFSMFNAHSRASMVCRILDTPIYPTLLVISICDPQYIPDHSWFPGYLAFGQNVYYIYIYISYCWLVVSHYQLCPTVHHLVPITWSAILNVSWIPNVQNCPLYIYIMSISISFYIYIIDIYIYVYIYMYIIYLSNYIPILSMTIEHEQLHLATTPGPLKKSWKTWMSFTSKMKKTCWFIWVNYNISLTWIKAIWGWFPILTIIPVRSQWGRYNLPRFMVI